MPRIDWTPRRAKAPLEAATSKDMRSNPLRARRHDIGKNRILSMVAALATIPLVACAASAASVVTPGAGVWTTHGPPGGPVEAVVIDPSNPRILYAGTDGDGVFKSTDGGTTWNAVTGLTEPYVNALVIDPRHGQTIYAAAPFGNVFKTTDGGRTWSHAETGGDIMDALAIAPSNPAVLYEGGQSLGGGPILFRSVNAGRSWRRIPSRGAPIRSIAVDPHAPRVLYVGGGYHDGSGSIYKTTDDGSHWQKLANPAAVDALTIDPRDSSVVYAGTNNGVLKSMDGGHRWGSIEPGTTGHIREIVIEHQNDDVLFAATGGSPPGSLVFLPSGGVFKSANGGTTWHQMDHGMPRDAVPAIAIDPSHPAVLYAGSDDGMFKTTNGGRAWGEIDAGLSNRPVDAIATDPTNSLVIYAAFHVVFGFFPPLVVTSLGTFKSIDGGGTWSPSTVGIEKRPVWSFAIDLTNPQVIYAGTRQYGVFKSSNGGATWIPANAGIEHRSVKALSIDPSNPQTIYAGTEGLGVTEGAGVMKSTDGGGTWRPANAGIEHADVFALAIDPRNPQTLYAGINPLLIPSGTVAGVFKSTDGGGTWSPANAGIEDQSIVDIAIDPSNAQTIYAAARSTLSGGAGGLFKSTDGGTTWVRENVGSFDFEAVVIDPVNSNVVYVGTFSEGVFESRDGGATWVQMNTGLINLDVLTLEIDPTGSFLHAGTEGGEYDLKVT